MQVSCDFDGAAELAAAVRRRESNHHDFVSWNTAFWGLNDSAWGERWRPDAKSLVRASSASSFTFGFAGWRRGHNGTLASRNHLWTRLFHTELGIDSARHRDCAARAGARSPTLKPIAGQCIWPPKRQAVDPQPSAVSSAAARKTCLHRAFRRFDRRPAPRREKP
jgi:hypothetical protein